MIFWKDPKENNESGSDSAAQSGWLGGKLLVSTPLVQDSCFQHSVIFMCDHNKSGAMGFIINKELRIEDPRDLFTRMGLPYEEGVHIPVLLGGPVETVRGFVVHTDDYQIKNTINFGSGVSITSERQIIDDYIRGRGPRNLMMVMGYSGWVGGQLEQEITENSWITLPLDMDIIFNTENDSKWQLAASQNGIDMMKVSPFTGSA